MERQDAVQERIDGLAVCQGATMSNMGLGMTNPDISTIYDSSKPRHGTYYLTSPTSPLAAALCSSRFGSDRITLRSTSD